MTVSVLKKTDWGQIIRFLSPIYKNTPVVPSFHLSQNSFIHIQLISKPKILPLFQKIAPILRKPIPPEVRQLVLVTTPDWRSASGELRRFSRSSSTAPWKREGEPIRISVGAKGLGWGIGLHGELPPLGRIGPIKKEGDNRGVAGVFPLGNTYGLPPHPPEGTGLPYTQMTSTLRCIDDPASTFYNQIADQKSIKQDWSSAERMASFRTLYRWLIVIDQNQPRKPSAGSCIFLHITPRIPSSTAGCTALVETEMIQLMKWLKKTPTPIYVALPAKELGALRKEWGLP